MIERGDRYSTGAIVLHWTVAVLILVNLFIGLFHESLLEGVRVMPLHKSIGVTVLVLSVARLAWRLAHRPPQLPDGMAAWEKTLAKGVHWVFYLLMLAMPLTGWIFSSNPARPRPFDWFGVFQLPLLPVSGGAAAAAHEAHELLGWLMTALVLLHVAAALRHHFIQHDKVLVRMAPWFRRNA
ncbi:MAG: cytochrome b [Sphingomonas sp.]|uniref:cytochrome b n=1 Tax=Sphingomonas sp. TaxID=28214 RepID=UPI001B20E7E0|nr:cytochrome b [Sphingomonas sp.]MBO9621166.1 cytochrome b [Sphingomonas sp.]